MLVKISRNDKGNPPGKLADAELHFTEGALDGLKLIGFCGLGAAQRQRAATSPSPRGSTRSTASAAASRCCARIVDGHAQDRLRDLILRGVRRSTRSRRRWRSDGRGAAADAAPGAVAVGRPRSAAGQLLAQPSVELGSEEAGLQAAVDDVPRQHRVLADRSRNTYQSASTPASATAARHWPPLRSAASITGATRRSPSDSSAW